MIPTSGRAWERSATSVERESRLEDALEFTADLRGAGSRDVWGALEQALDDSSVEVVYLLVSGLPLRGAGSRDPEAFHEEFRALNARRGVAVHVIYVLGPATDSARGRAARQDQQARLDALYKPIAEESGGTVQVGESLPALEDARRAAALEAGEGGRRRRR